MLLIALCLLLPFAAAEEGSEGPTPSLYEEASVICVEVFLTVPPDVEIRDDCPLVDL